VERIPEPELMLDPAQARAYASADFSEPHDRFVALVRERCAPLPEAGRALDLGCGPGDVTLRFARALPGWSVDGIDGSPAMLALAREAAVRGGLQSRVRFREARLPEDAPAGLEYDLVFSNSLLHHLAAPDVLWSSLVRLGRPAARVFVMDLLRPGSADDARLLVERYAASEPEVLRRDFHRSLLAAYRPAEVRDQLARAGLPGLEVAVVSDRHLAVWGMLPDAQR
jgi:SAM-dependent methyltransferase